VKRAEVFLSLSALDKLRSLRGSQSRSIAQFIDFLADNPDTPGDSTMVDETGRRLQISVIDRHAVVFWYDSPVSEIKVTRIVPTA
jgi:hypothetical protein